MKEKLRNVNLAWMLNLFVASAYFIYLLVQFVVFGVKEGWQVTGIAYLILLPHLLCMVIASYLNYTTIKKPSVLKAMLSMVLLLLAALFIAFNRVVFVMMAVVEIIGIVIQIVRDKEKN